MTIKTEYRAICPYCLESIDLESFGEIPELEVIFECLCGKKSRIWWEPEYISMPDCNLNQKDHAWDLNGFCEICGEHAPKEESCIEFLNQ